MVCSDISFTVVPSRGNVFIVYSNAKYDGEYDVSLVARLKLAHVYDTYTIIIFDVNTERKYFDLKRYSFFSSAISSRGSIFLQRCFGLHNFAGRNLDSLRSFAIIHACVCIFRESEIRRRPTPRSVVSRWKLFLALSFINNDG